MTPGRLSFVQIISREQTVAMETVVSDAVGKATPTTSVEERTKQNIVRGSQSTQGTPPPQPLTHTHSPSLRKST